MDKNSEISNLKMPVQSSYGLRPVPARLATQAEKSMERVVDKELAGVEVKRKPGRHENTKKWVENTPKMDTFASDLVRGKPQPPDPTLLIENPHMPTTLNTCMVLPEVVHRKLDSDRLDVRPSTEGVTSTPPLGLEPHPQGSG